MNARLLDLEHGALRDAAEIRIEGERIVEIAAEGQGVTRSDSVPRLDARGHTLMPGLIDAHVHAAITTMDLPALFRRQVSWRSIETKFILEGMLQRGFTTVRDAGGLDPGIMNALQAGLVKGPRVFRSGRMLSQTGGHGDSEPAAEHPQICACSIRTGAFSHVADGVDAVRRAAREELKSGAQQIKIMAGGGVATPSDPIDMVQYTEAEIRAAVEEAGARRTYAFAHAYIPEAIQRATRAGVRSIEHGNLLDADAARAMASAGCFLVPTLVTYEQLAEAGKALKFPDASLRKVDEVRHAGIGAIDIARAQGVQIGFGTDLLGETHPQQSREFLLRTEVQSNLEILRSATVVNADLLLRSGVLGVVRPGAFADLLLVEGDPLADISVLTGQGERIPFIMRGGQVCKDRIT